MTERTGDIVERLRDCKNGIGDFKTDRGDFGLCEDAADEIERLRSELLVMRRERDDLQAFCKGVATNINNMLRPVGVAQKDQNK